MPELIDRRRPRRSSSRTTAVILVAAGVAFSPAVVFANDSRPTSAALPIATLGHRVLRARGMEPERIAESHDSASARKTVEAFHDALASGDSARALALLAPDVVVLESGEVERYAD